jgi:hypothetical protein
MKKIILFILLCTACFGYIDANDVEAIEAAKVELKEKVRQFPDKKKQLETKTYSGTFAEILEARGNDANDVATDARLITNTAEEIAKAEKLELRKTEALKHILSEKTEEKKLGKKTILLEVTGHVNDELEAIDPNDPNSITKTENTLELMSMLIDMERAL